MTPTITVVTPSYNQARFLKETLESIRAQHPDVHEHFVFDGGSTDASAEIIRAHEAHLACWESAKDNGQADAIAKGFARATGDILCWLNSDDVFLPGALARVRAAFACHPDWDVLTAWHVQMDAGSRVLAAWRMPAESEALARAGVMHVCQQTCFFRRALYERVGGLDTALHCVMDRDLWLRFFRAGAVWGHIPAYLAGFRQHAETKNATWTAKYEEERQLARRRYPEFPQGRGVRSIPGRAWHAASMAASGRLLAQWYDTRRLRGRLLSEVFAPKTRPPEAGLAVTR